MQKTIRDMTKMRTMTAPTMINTIAHIGSNPPELLDVEEPVETEEVLLLPSSVELDAIDAGVPVDSSSLVVVGSDPESGELGGPSSLSLPPILLEGLLFESSLRRRHLGLELLERPDEMLSVPDKPPDLGDPKIPIAYNYGAKLTAT